MHKGKKRKKKERGISGFGVNGVFHAVVTSQENDSLQVFRAEARSLWNTIYLQTILSKTLLTD